MFSYELKRGTLTVCLMGELDHSAAARVRAEIDPLIDGAGVRIDKLFQMCGVYQVVERLA